MNSGLLSQLIASTVMAGELSLMAAHVAGDLVSAHEKLGHILFCNQSFLYCTKSAITICFFKHFIQ